VPTVTARPRRPTATRSAGKAVATRSAPRPRPVVLRVAVVALGLGFGATLALGVTAESWSQVRAPGGVAMFLGSMTGLAGTYLALVMVLLVSRVPIVERVLGQDGLLRAHRRLAPWPLSLIAAHVALLTLAYAQAAHTGPSGSSRSARSDAGSRGSAGGRCTCSCTWRSPSRSPT